jgi:predicted membrane-bound spermidine synthase
VFVVSYLSPSKENILKIILTNALIITLCTNPGLPLILTVNEILNVHLRDTGQDLMFINYFSAIGLTVFVGVASGIELPLYSKLFEQFSNRGSESLVGVLISDYLGAFLASVAFAILLYPWTGIMGSIAIPQFILLTIINIIAHKSGVYRESTSFKIFLQMTNIVIILSFCALPNFTHFLDSFSK